MTNQTSKELRDWRNKMRRYDRRTKALKNAMRVIGRVYGKTSPTYQAALEVYRSHAFDVLLTGDACPTIGPPVGLYDFLHSQPPRAKSESGRRNGDTLIFKRVPPKLRTNLADCGNIDYVPIKPLTPAELDAAYKDKTIL